LVIGGASIGINNVMTVLACAVCFQPGHILSEATGWAILVMLLVLLPIFGGLVAFFITIARRAKAVEDRRAAALRAGNLRL